MQFDRVALRVFSPEILRAGRARQWPACLTLGSWDGRHVQDLPHPSIRRLDDGGHVAMERLAKTPRLFAPIVLAPICAWAESGRTGTEPRRPEGCLPLEYQLEVGLR